MIWFELRVLGVSKESLDDLSDFLEQQGALSVTFADNEDEPIFEPELNTTPFWSETITTVIFNDRVERDECQLAVIESYPHAKLIASELEDKAWEREWLRDFKPTSFGRRLWICPIVCEPPDPGAVNIMLDPGLAFGTGTHPTTALCLSFLDGLDCEEKIVCDYGTGSGILAISALKLGAAHAYATDIDPQAITAIIDNAKRNAIDLSTLEAGLVDSIEVPQCDLVMANILAGPLVELAPKLISLVKPSGSLILSGILSEQLEEIIQAYTKLMTLERVEEKDEWQLVVLRR